MTAPDLRPRPADAWVTMRAFNVRRTLAGRKTQMRRLLRVQPDMLPRLVEVETTHGVTLCATWVEDGEDVYYESPFGPVGGRIWVKEPWAAGCGCGPEAPSFFEADAPTTPGRQSTAWKDPATLPKSRARLWLRCDDIRIERLQDMTEADAAAEACDGPTTLSPLDRFRSQWDHYAEPGKTWAANFFVWVLTFHVIERPVLPVKTKTVETAAPA